MFYGSCCVCCQSLPVNVKDYATYLSTECPETIWNDLQRPRNNLKRSETSKKPHETICNDQETT